MIRPTIGRQVWYWPRVEGSVFSTEQPCAATICYVQDDRLVNLQVIDHAGIPRAETSVVLRHGDEDPHAAWVYPYAEWMPFQKGQAAKTEQVEKAMPADER